MTIFWVLLSDARMWALNYHAILLVGLWEEGNPRQWFSSLQQQKMCKMIVLLELELRTEAFKTFLLLENVYKIKTWVGSSFCVIDPILRLTHVMIMIVNFPEQKNCTCIVSTSRVRYIHLMIYILKWENWDLGKENNPKPNRGKFQSQELNSDKLASKALCCNPTVPSSKLFRINETSSKVVCLKENYF